MRRVVIVIVIVIVGSLVGTDPARATSVACGGTVSTSMTLTADVGSSAVPCSADGLTITRSGITLDLGHHTIWGDNAGADDAGIRLPSGVRKVTIKNGTVRDFGYGVITEGVNDHSAITHLVLASNGYGLQTTTGAQFLTIANTTAVNNGLDGMSIGGDATEVTNSIATRNTRGIAFGAFGVKVSNSVAARNTGDGIVISGDGTATDNSSVANGGDGIDSNFATSDLSGNTVAGNGGDGIVGTASDSTFVSNRAVGNALDGIHAEGFNMTIRSNTVDGNDDDGIDLSGDQGVVTSNTVRGNGKDADDYGVQIDGTGDTLKKNSVRGNNSDGIHQSSGTGMTASDNTLVGNGFGTGAANDVGEGLDSGGVAVTASGNVAQANDHHDCNPIDSCTYGGTSIAHTATPSCGTSISESTKLVADVGSSGAPCTGDGLIITKNGVTVDLNGHTVYGDGGSNDRGISLQDHKDVTVTNGRVVGFGKGVIGASDPPVTDANDAVVGVMVSGGFTGFEFSGVQAVIKNSAAAAANLGYLIESAPGKLQGDVAVAGLDGILSTTKHAATIGAVVRYPGRFGITSASGGPVSGSATIHTLSTGISTSGGSVSASEAIAAGLPSAGGPFSSDGIKASGDGPVVTKNVVVLAQNRGIFVDGDHATVRSNKVVRSVAAGIEATGLAPTIAKGSVLANGAEGVRAIAARSSVTNVTAIANRYGIYVEGPHVSVTNSRAHANDVDGVLAGAASGTIDENVADGNGHAPTDLDGLGVRESTPGMSGQNSALGNDDPAECAPTNVC